VQFVETKKPLRGGKAHFVIPLGLELIELII
jgi:hypothetical protein